MARHPWGMPPEQPFIGLTAQAKEMKDRFISRLAVSHSLSFFLQVYVQTQAGRYSSPM